MQLTPRVPITIRFFFYLKYISDPEYPYFLYYLNILNLENITIIIKYTERIIDLIISITPTSQTCILVPIIVISVLNSLDKYYFQTIFNKKKQCFDWIYVYSFEVFKLNYDKYVVISRQLNDRKTICIELANFHLQNSVYMCYRK